jgi:hypothetical protein
LIGSWFSVPLLQSSEPSAAFATGTIATRLGSRQPAFDNGAGAADIRHDRYGVDRAVKGARATFHAAIFIRNRDPLAGYGKHLMRTYNSAHATLDAFFFRQ